MANEISVSASLNISNGTAPAVTQSYGARLFTQAGKRVLADVQQIGTSEEAIGFAELATMGWCLFANLDPTNYIEFYITSGGTAFAKLQPGAMMLIPLDQTTLYAKAHTGACYLQKLVGEV